MATSPDRTTDSLKKSWSRSPKTGTTDMQQVDASKPSPNKRATSPTRSSPLRVRSGSPRRAPSPVDPKDPNTTLVGSVGSLDAKATLVVGDSVWVGERDGSITIHNFDGDVIHIIEKRKGAVVWTLAKVGDYVWAGCSDGFIRVLSVQTYKMERQFARHAGGGGGVNAIAFHSPSNTVFSGSNDFEILAWDATSTDFLRQLPMQSGVRALIADVHVLYAGADNGLIVAWDIRTGERLQQWSGHTRSVLSLTQTETHIWSGSEDSTIRIWNPATGEAIGVAEVHTGAVSVLTTVGNKVWSGAGDNVCVWDAEKLKLLGTYVAHEGHLDSITVVAKAALYKVWTSASDKTAKSWQSQIIPDESEALKAKIARLQHAEYENRVLKEQLAQRDARIESLLTKQQELESEIGRLKALEGENAQLRQELKDRDDAIHRLRRQLEDSEALNHKLATDIAALGRLIDELKGENTRLSSDLDRSKAENLSLEQKLRDTIDSYEAKLRDTVDAYEAKIRGLLAEIQGLKDKNAELSAQNSHLRTELDAVRGENARLAEELKRAYSEIDAMSLKLKEMDTIFKSRLSLITEVFKTYKKYEQVEKKLRGLGGDIRDPFASAQSDFKATIAHHFTDDELAHLGSSRHFFQVLTEGSPAKSPKQV